MSCLYGGGEYKVGASTIYTGLEMCLPSPVLCVYIPRLIGVYSYDNYKHTQQEGR